eukprot:scaffold144594_cov17-Prasinocladus_malaysianus.AAC.1
MSPFNKDRKIRRMAGSALDADSQNCHNVLASTAYHLRQPYMPASDLQSVKDTPFCIKNVPISSTWHQPTKSRGIVHKTIE